MANSPRNRVIPMVQPEPVVRTVPRPSLQFADWLLVLFVGGAVTVGIYFGLKSLGVPDRYQLIAAIFLGLLLMRDVTRQLRDRRRRR